MKNAIFKGWGKSGIIDGIKMENSKLLPLDTFDELDPLWKDQEEFWFDGCVMKID